MEKTCTGCDQSKPINQFGKNRYAQDKLNYRCKECCKLYAQSNAGKEASKRADRRFRRSEKGEQSRKRYFQSSEGKQSQKRYDQSSKGKQRHARYNKSKKGKHANRKRAFDYRARKTQTDGSCSTREWYELCEFYSFHCLKCNKKFPFEKLTLDHIKPVSNGGSNFIFNIQPLCGPCNSKKGNKEIDYRQTLPDWINRDGPIWIQDSLFHSFQFRGG